MNLHVSQTEKVNNLPSSLNSFETPTMLRTNFLVFAKALDLVPVKFKLVKEKGWTFDRANNVEPQYKAFLFLIGGKDGYYLVPTHDIDEMWHAHILDTRKYMADCAKHFGAYVHHYPYLGLKDEDDATRAKGIFDDTCSIIAKTLDVKIGGYELANCGGGCSGGGGCSSSCGGGHSSCSSGSHSSCTSGHHSSCGGGHHTPSHTPTSDVGYTPIISSCSTSSDDRSTSIRRTPDKSRRPPAAPPRPVEKRRGIISRILGLMPQEQMEWYASVTPEYFMQDEYRPDAAALDALGHASNSVH
jgi:hypothetical protein